MSGAEAGPGPRAVLLDTCAVIWLANGDQMARTAVAAIVHAGLADGVFVSPVSAWEVGLLARPSQAKSVSFLPDPKTWFTRVMSGPAIRPAPFTPEIAIDSSCLPGMVHGDPADRLIIATARHLGVPVVTRDARIRAYAEAGHVQVIPC
jgi:PIN domain nuclease of toxin-antitoxin system